MDNQTLFKYLKIGDEFIMTPSTKEALNSEKPFYIFRKTKEHKMGRLLENNVERRVDGKPSHVPDNVSVILLENIPKEITIV